MTSESTGTVGLRPRHVEPVALSDVCARIGVPAHDGRVTGLSLASTAVEPGDLYAALPGARTHGARYARDAIASGAVAIMTDPAGADIVGDAEVPVLVVETPRAVLGELAAFVYGEPAAAITTIGVTGTQGKTTVTRLMEGALSSAGEIPGVVGTIGTRVAGHPVPSALTTPEAPALHALFAGMRDEGVTACAVEVSSHALVQGRVDGVVFDVAVFLNLGRDHLDFHGSIEDYFAAKATLFTPERARRAVVNVADAYGRRLAASTTLPVTTFSTEGEADWSLDNESPHPTGTDASFVGPNGARVDVSVPLPGSFNVSNALAVIAALDTAGFDPQAAAGGVASSPGVPGRMQRITGGQDFQVVVDYAHKPDAVEAVLATLRPVTTGRLIVVVGAGGDRDAGKRPVMGEIAARLADVVIVTDDNPRSENPAAIRAAVRTGAERGTADVREIGDRARAIRDAIGLAKGAGDTVVIAGKGHEQGQEIGGRVHPFDDVAQAEAELTALLGEGSR